MKIAGRYLILVALFALLAVKVVEAQENWRIYSVSTTLPAARALKTLSRFIGPPVQNNEPIQVDPESFCERLKASEKAVFVAAASTYRRCYPATPVFGAFDLPFPIKDWTSAIQIADGPIGVAFTEGLNRLGVEVLAFWTGDTNAFVSTTPLKSGSSFKGMTVLVPDSFSSKTFVAENGGKAQVVTGGRVQVGFVDAASQAVQVPLSGYTNFPDQKGQYVLLSGSSFDPLVVSVADKAWYLLTELQRGRLESVVRDVTAAERADALNRSQEDIDLLKQRGADITTLSGATLTSFNLKALNEASAARAVDVFAQASEGLKQASIYQANGNRMSPYATVYFVTNRAVADRFQSATVVKQLSYGKADIELSYESPNPLNNLKDRLFPFKPSGRGVDVDWNSITTKPFPNGFTRVPPGAPTKAPLVYVHGFANNFEDALRGAAWVAWNSKRPVIAFSWPARGDLTPSAYRADQRSADASEAMLAQLLGQIGRDDDTATEVDIVAHSMGARVLLGALNKLNAERTQGKAPKFRQLILAAPDVSQSQLHRQWPRLFTYFERVATLYVSDHDRALLTSMKYLNSGEGARAGLAPPVEIEGGIQSIFVGNDEFSATGHSYLTANGHAARDMMELLRYGTDAKDRAGCGLATNGADYYELRSLASP
jgi:esterase/lipase superfamily enzyme